MSEIELDDASLLFDAHLTGIHHAVVEMLPGGSPGVPHAKPAGAIVLRADGRIDAANTGEETSSSANAPTKRKRCTGTSQESFTPSGRTPPGSTCATPRFANVCGAAQSVISEACFLLAQTRTGGAPVLEMLARKAVSLPFRLEDYSRSIRLLMRKYADVPMSLADACLVRMAEVTLHSTVLTLDRDFKVYRKHGRQVIPLIIPR